MITSSLNTVNRLITMDRNKLLSIVDEDSRSDVDRIGSISDAPFAKEVGIKTVLVSRERTVAEMLVRPGILNSLGVVHGAATYALIDHAFGVASNVSRDSVGQCVNVHYYRTVKDGLLRAEAVLINESNSISNYDVKVYSGDDLIASAVCTGFKIKVRK